MEKKVLKRNEVEAAHKWAIEDLFQKDEDWKQEYEQTKELIVKLGKYQGKLSETPDTLLEFLNMENEVSLHIERIYVYANQKYHEDTSNGTYQGLADQASRLVVELESAMSFVVPEILTIPAETIEKYIAKQPGLKIFQFNLQEILRKKPHTLTAEMEELVAKAGELSEGPKNIFSMFNNADIKFPEIEDENGELVEITHGRFISLMESSNERVRREAFQKLYETYNKFRNTIAATFSANVKQEAFYAKVRQYPSAMDMRLFLSNIPRDVYTNLIASVHENLHLLHRYVSLRKKLMGVEELHMYDLYTPIVTEADVKISYAEAKEMVYEGLRPLGEDYLKVLKEGFDNRWIDVYENEGKRSGAYSWGAYGTHPYVLLNYQETLNNVFTLAHEMGHALHSYYSDAAQPINTAAYKTFVAEVASTCNEALLMEYLLGKTEDKKQRAYLINYFLEQFRSTLYRQAMFAEFEMITHQKAQEGTALTADILCEIYRGLIEQYFGSDIVIDKEIDMEWSRIPHFYTAFYVYQYATGYSAAMALSRKILQEGKTAVDAYINNFLSGGGSDYPIELLKKAGVDMSTREPVNQALALFGRLLDEMETLLA
ncbi:oligoendopeptidase F [Anaerocolumna cellulosilytica]|uniref:Oligopeptidase F n=1 Tax=Anaerocolumna cellulosilytica TaxID=433286 RepID=A0A6S6R7Y6_9FIRM|nr:oligoendopeptidase F [Anaerocolumna cellulosilytica]MBB5197443.1 oligoendopeptidase F [Anaerocolumna cellulosilytica]BCJ95462.1 oligoendopeptidase F [Anaerocolumna cellulosilytica]